MDVGPACCLYWWGAASWQGQRSAQKRQEGWPLFSGVRGQHDRLLALGGHQEPPGLRQQHLEPEAACQGLPGWQELP